MFTFVFQGFSRAQPTQPSTQPGLDYYSGARGLSLFRLGQDNPVRVIISLNADVRDLSDLNELTSLLNGLSWQPPGAKPYLVLTSIDIPDKGRPLAADEHLVLADLSLMVDQPPQSLFEDLYKQAQASTPARPENAPQFILPGRGGSGRQGPSVVGGRRGGLNDPSMPAFLELLRPKIDELTGETVQRLKTLVASEPQMSPQQRNQRLDEIHTQTESLSRKMGVLAQLSRAQPDAAARVAEKLKNLRDREQDLQMKLSAQEARRQALEQGLDNLKKQVQEQRKEDPKLDYMRLQLDLKQKAFDRVKGLAASEAVTNSQVEQAEADVKEAQASLAIAQAEAAKGGQGELMDRLTNELTMVSIDTTDLQIQLKQLHDLMTNYDPAELNEASLNALLAGENGFGGAESANLPPLYYELQKQFHDLRREELVLIVDDVNLVTEQPQPQQ